MIIAVNGLVTGPKGERGVAGAGKDEVARRLVDKYDFVVVSLADPLKRFCQDVYEFSNLQLWGPSEERNKEDPRYPLPTETGKYLTPRQALQTLGTEWARSNYSDTWVDYALRMYKRLQEDDCYYDRVSGLRPCSSAGGFLPNGHWVKAKTNVVVPDTRFLNEMRAVKKAGGYVVRVKRNYNVLPGYFGGHLSETELLNEPDSSFDAVLRNSGTLDQLRNMVDQMMETLHVNCKQEA